MKRSFAIAVAVLAASWLGAVAHAEDFTNPSSNNYWGESYTDPSGNYFSPAANTTVSGGVLSAPIQTDNTEITPAGNTDGSNLNDTNDVVNYVRTFANTPPVVAGAHYNGTLLGNLSGKTSISATFNLSDSAVASGAQFTDSEIVGQGTADNGFSGPEFTSLRLVFTGSDLDNEWWSTAGVEVTDMDNGTNVTLTVDFNPSQWSNLNGINGAADTTDFNAALADVTRLGISFGSGYFYSDGFSFDTGGTADFNLDSISTTPATPLPSAVLSGGVLMLGLLAYRLSRRQLDLA